MPVLPTLKRERELWQQGFGRIAGVDEVGRGCIAGPLVSSAVIFSDKIYIPQLKESKSVPPEKRKKLFIKILSCAEKVSYSVISTKTINKFGLNYANWLAMKTAVENIDFIFDIVVIHFISGRADREIQREGNCLPEQSPLAASGNEEEL